MPVVIYINYKGVHYSVHSNCYMWPEIRPTTKSYCLPPPFFHPPMMQTGRPRTFSCHRTDIFGLFRILEKKFPAQHYFILFQVPYFFDFKIFLLALIFNKYLTHSFMYPRSVCFFLSSCSIVIEYCWFSIFHFVNFHVRMCTQNIKLIPTSMTKFNNQRVHEDFINIILHSENNHRLLLYVYSIFCYMNMNMRHLAILFCVFFFLVVGRGLK